MFCEKCGSPVSDNAKFRKFCGSPLQAGGEATVSGTASGYFQAPVQFGYPEGAGTSAVAAVKKKSPMSKKKKAGLIIAIIAAVLVVAALVAFFVWRQLEKEEMERVYDNLADNRWEYDSGMSFTNDENGYVTMCSYTAELNLDASGSFRISGYDEYNGHSLPSAHGTWSYDYQNRLLTMRFSDGTVERWDYGADDNFTIIHAHTACLGNYEDLDFKSRY